MKIVSGKTGSPHVTSHEFRQIIEGAIGQGSYILESGDNLEPELVSNNLLKIKSGMMSHHGNVSSVENYDEIEITNGTQGMKRIDLIVNRYTRNDETKIEDSSWVVIQGTPDASSPVAPPYIEGNMQNGDLIDDCPVFELHLDGINVIEVKKLINTAQNISLLQEMIENQIVTYTDKISLTNSAYIEILSSTLRYNRITGEVNIRLTCKTIGAIPAGGAPVLGYVNATFAPENIRYPVTVSFAPENSCQAENGVLYSKVATDYPRGIRVRIPTAISATGIYIYCSANYYIEPGLV